MNASFLLTPFLVAVVSLLNVVPSEAAMTTVYTVIPPVSFVPKWGAMRSPDIWSASYEDLAPSWFVPLPAYDLPILTVPLAALVVHRTEEHEAMLTAKLTYSTRHFGRYHLDSDEYEGMHPGIDIKLALHTPIAAIAEGTVHAVRDGERLGTYVILEHELPEEGSVYSIYGHLAEVSVREGASVMAGDIIGIVGTTGNTSAPHLHLQIDHKVQEGPHVVFWPLDGMSREELDRHTLHPMEIIEKYGDQSFERAVLTSSP